MNLHKKHQGINTHIHMYTQIEILIYTLHLVSHLNLIICVQIIILLMSLNN
jgi:hypothetical protein